jgi:hypothetical protein
MDNSKYSGYVSDQAKRRFTISVGVLGGIFFFAQFIVPFIIMIAFMPLMIFSGGFELKNPLLCRRYSDTFPSGKITFLYEVGRYYFLPRGAAGRPAVRSRILAAGC